MYLLMELQLSEKAMQLLGMIKPPMTHHLCPVVPVQFLLMVLVFVGLVTQLLVDTRHQGQEM
jgi:hypothetical protein